MSIERLRVHAVYASVGSIMRSTGENEGGIEEDGRGARMLSRVANEIRRKDLVWARTTGVRVCWWRGSMVAIESWVGRWM